MDKLDLLGVRHDCEMELQARYDLAKTICDFWKDRSENFYDFKTNCICTICYELKIDKNDVEEINEIWYEIVEYYMEKMRVNIKDVESYGNHALIKNYNDSWIEDIVFNDVHMNKYYSLIDMQKCGENIGAKIISNDIVFESEKIDENFKDELLTYIEENVTNIVRDNICYYVLKHLNNNL